jgi:hypothetical protein
VSSTRRPLGHAVTAGPQAMLVVEYPCDRFCRIEVDLGAESGQITLQQMREKADRLHEREHQPGLDAGDAGDAGDAPVAAPEATGRPAATVFLSAPGRADRRR